MTTSNPKTPISQSLRRELRRSRLLIVVCAVVFLLLGVLASFRSGSYASTVEVLVKPVVGSAFSPDTLGNPQEVTVGLETESHLVGDPQVLDLVPRALGRAINDDRVKVSGEILTNSQILAIEVTGSSTGAARSNATRVSAAYLSAREAQAVTLRRRQTAGLEKQIASTSTQLQASSLRAQSRNPPPGVDATVQLLATRVTSLQNALGSAQSVATDPGKIVGAATRPASFNVRSHVGLPLAGLVGGLLIGLILALLRAGRSDRIDPDEASLDDVPVWLSLGAMTSDRSSLLLREEDSGPIRERYRRLRTSLLADTDLPQVLAVSSHLSFAPLTAIATNLSLSLADAGYKVVLVDAVIDEPQVAKLTDRDPNLPGTADLLRNQRQRALRSTAFEGMHVVTAGHDPAQVRDLYSGQPLRTALGHERKKRDIVVVVTPPLSTSSGLAVAATADDTLLVADLGRDTYRSMRSTIAAAVSSGATVRAIVTARELPANAPADEPSALSAGTGPEPEGAQRLDDHATGQAAPLEMEPGGTEATHGHHRDPDQNPLVTDDELPSGRRMT